MLKWTAIVSGMLVVCAWLAASVFVARYEPAGFPETALVLVTTEDGRKRWRCVDPTPVDPGRTTTDGFFHHSAYVSSGGATYGPGEPGEHAYAYVVARGAPDVGQGTIPVTVGCVYRDWIRLREARLEVSSDANWTQDGATWTVLGTRALDTDGPWQTVAIQAHAPMDTVAVQLVAVAPGDEAWSFGTSIPRSHDWRDRLIEDLASYSVLRWLTRSD